MPLNKQQKIVNWFDITYKRKGFSYLRPSEAYEVFTKILNLKSGDSVLDVACGPGLFLRLANEIDCRCTGIDASKEAVKMARNYTPESEIYLILWTINMKILRLQNTAGHQDAKSLDQWKHVFESNGFNIEKIFPDQWPLHKIISFFPLFIKKRIMLSIHKGVLPLNLSGEFIFLLSKKNP